MTTLLILASVILLGVVAVQIGRISELSAKIRGEEAVQEESDKFNSTFGVFFMVGFLIFCFASAWYYKNYMLGYGPLKAASEHGSKIQMIFNITLFFTTIVFVVTQIALFWFAYKFRGQKGRKAQFISHDNRLEIIWTAIPAVVMCVLVISGLYYWNDIMSDVKKGEDYLEIESTGYQFAWDLRYPGADKTLGEKNFRYITPGVNDLGVDYNDKFSYDDVILAGSDEVVIPKGKKVRVRITAKDVLHNFYLPHFQVKMDAIPGIPTYFVFTPKMTTEEYRSELRKYPEYNVPADPADPTGPKKWEAFNYELACAELCGKGHFSMRRVIKVVSQDEYNKWIEGKKAFYLENIKDKIPPGQYPWYKGVFAAKPIEFSSAAIESAKVGEVLGLNHVTFATGSAQLTPESTKELDEVVAVMKKFPTMTVEVSGHTDNIGEAEANKTLSEARAKAVVDYVIKKGIVAERMISAGFGDTRPVADNGTPEGRQQNRRTEFKIMTK